MEYLYVWYEATMEYANNMQIYTAEARN